jgi:hypothetical protein
MAYSLRSEKKRQEWIKIFHKNLICKQFHNVQEIPDLCCMKQDSIFYNLTLLNEGVNKVEYYMNVGLFYGE